MKDISPFCGTTDIPVLDFWWCLLWVSKPEWAALFAHGRGVHVTCSPRFTSGVIPANLLVVSMAAEPFSSMYLLAGIGVALNRDLSCLHTHALPTEWAMPAQLPMIQFFGVYPKFKIRCFLSQKQKGRLCIVNCLLVVVYVGERNYGAKIWPICCTLGNVSDCSF